MEETLIAFLLKEIFGINVPPELLGELVDKVPALFNALFKDKRELTTEEMQSFNELKIKARLVALHKQAQGVQENFSNQVASLSKPQDIVD